MKTASMILLAAAFFACSPLAIAAVLEVPATYPTIQAAIGAAADGDVVSVAPGTYVENIDFLGMAIVVRSTDGAAVTPIDGSNPADANRGSVVIFENGEGPESVLEGFTIQNGSGVLWGVIHVGGGIYCRESSPTITGNVISGHVCENGAGIYCSGDEALIRDNTITDNWADKYGGGIYCRMSLATISENRLLDNTADTGAAVACAYYSDPMISGNLMEGTWARWLDVPRSAGRGVVGIQP